MKLDITEEGFDDMLYAYSSSHNHTTSQQDAIAVLKQLGITFKKELDWKAETHDPTQIPDKWLVEAWDNYSTHMRVTGFFAKGNGGTYFPYGERAGAIYDNYRAIKKEDWPKWAVEAHKSLGGLDEI